VIYVVAFLMLFGVGWALDRVGPSDARSEENEKGRQAALQNVVPNLQGATGGSEL